MVTDFFVLIGLQSNKSQNTYHVSRKKWISFIKANKRYLGIQNKILSKHAD